MYMCTLLIYITLKHYYPDTLWIRKDKLEVKSFTEIASKIIPKNFFTKYIPDFPSKR